MLKTAIDILATASVLIFMLGMAWVFLAGLVREERDYTKRRNQRGADWLGDVGILVNRNMPALPGFDREQWRRNLWVAKRAGFVDMGPRGWVDCGLNRA